MDDLTLLAKQIKHWGQKMGFSQVAISDLDVSDQKAYFDKYIQAGMHGTMQWLETHADLRFNVDKLVPGAVRAIVVRLDYLPDSPEFSKQLSDPNHGYVSRYAWGRDYHKLMRKMLKNFAIKIEQESSKFNYRPFVDSGPVLEKTLATKAGLGWKGKNGLTINTKAGSWYFLGELLVDIPLPIDKPIEEHCGQCVSCIKMCPTQALIKPYILDPRRCIAYLTIEHEGVIPTEFRQAIGNRIYGCDDCQIVCPWNKDTENSAHNDFQARPDVVKQSLLHLWLWDEKTFLEKTQGSPIRRIGYVRWKRNLSIALGNAPFSHENLDALKSGLNQNPIVDIHIKWAIDEQLNKQKMESLPNRQHLRLIRIIDKTNLDEHIAYVRRKTKPQD